MGAILPFPALDLLKVDPSVRAASGRARLVELDCRPHCRGYNGSSLDVEVCVVARARKVVAPMSEFDPDEMVQFYGKRQSLSDVVHEIMRQPPHRRAVVKIYRKGKEPSVLGASEIEAIAKLPAFKVAPDPARAEGPTESVSSIRG